LTKRLAPLWSVFVPFVVVVAMTRSTMPWQASRVARMARSRGGPDGARGCRGRRFRRVAAHPRATLVINSTQDNRIPRELAERVLGMITAPVEQHWLEGCGHVITVDYCKDEVARLVVAFLARHAG